LTVYKSGGAVAGERPVSVIHLFDLVSRNNQWLSVRQSAIAGNIANANTPGYKALDVEPFEKALEAARLTMKSTQPGHMLDDSVKTAAVDVRDSKSWETTHTGNRAGDDQRRRRQSRLPAQHRHCQGIPPHAVGQREGVTP
jgi:flagellar basal-body rod protein FlgB